MQSSINYMQIMLMLSQFKSQGNLTSCKNILDNGQCDGHPSLSNTDKLQDSTNNSVSVYTEISQCLMYM